MGLSDNFQSEYFMNDIGRYNFNKIRTILVAGDARWFLEFMCQKCGNFHLVILKRDS